MINYERLRRWPIPEIRQTYAAPQLILYALSLNLGQSLPNEGDLQYIYEDGLAPLPTVATVLGYPGFWMKEEGTGIDWRKVLHAEQSLEVHRTLPTNGTIVSRTTVEDIVDKGTIGAFIYTKREIRLSDTEELLCTLRQMNICRANGGFGGPSKASKPGRPMPQTPADEYYAHKTLPQQALIYRLNGDFNPLHADPKIAKAAGFERPILHGLCLFGIVAYRLIVGLCAHRAKCLKQIEVRFTGPIFPGETICINVWKVGPEQALFNASAVERNAMILDHGFAEFSSNK
jgi:acyl dehydratase